MSLCPWCGNADRDALAHRACRTVPWVLVAVLALALAGVGVIVAR